MIGFVPASLDVSCIGPYDGTNTGQAPMQVSHNEASTPNAFHDDDNDYSFAVEATHRDGGGLFGGVPQTPESEVHTLGNAARVTVSLATNLKIVE